MGELHVLSKLINRENEAHALLGDVGSLIGKHSVSGGEDEIRRVIQNQVQFADVVKTPEQIATEQAQSEEDLIDQLLAGFGLESDNTDNPSTTNTDNNTPDSTHAESLYPSEIAYLEDALNEAFYSAPERSLAAGGVSFQFHSNSVAELEPPEDLRRRFGCAAAGLPGGPQGAGEVPVGHEHHGGQRVGVSIRLCARTRNGARRRLRLMRLWRCRWV